MECVGVGTAFNGRTARAARRCSVRGLRRTAGLDGLDGDLVRLLGGGEDLHHLVEEGLKASVSTFS
jgi:hypothetical protein